MSSDRRRVAVALAGFSVFLNLYAPQSVLPLLAREFGAGAGETSLAITASTLAVALIAPFTGTFADVVGRKRVIAAAMFALVVPTAMVGLAPDIHALVFWRFVQGLTLPPIFAVMVAYIGEEWPAGEAIGVTGIYTSAASFGGFFGRLITGVLADWAGWRIAFLWLAALTLLLALGVAALLEQERRFVRSQNLLASVRQMLRHFRNPPLVATYAIGFGVLFTFIASFTYVNFYLAAPLFDLSATALGAIFVVYLGGSAIAPLTGRAVARFGRRPLILAAIGLWIGGLLLTLVPPGDHCGSGDQRHVRLSVPERVDELRRARRRARPFLGGRPLRHLVLRRRQRRRGVARIDLESNGVARLRRPGDRRAPADGRDGMALLARAAATRARAVNAQRQRQCR